MSDSHRDRDSLTVAIVGAGEMGAAVGGRLRQAGARVLTSLAGRSADSAARVRSVGLEVANDDDLLVRDASFVLSIVPPGVAVEVAERFRGPLGRAQSKPAFVECNAISPATCRRIHGLLGATRFIDAGIIGGPPAAGTRDPAKGPRFYASGPDAHLLTRLAGFGLDIAILDGPVGAASGLKLSYAGLTKGFTALCATMLGAASGCSDPRPEWIVAVRTTRAKAAAAIGDRGDISGDTDQAVYLLVMKGNFSGNHATAPPCAHAAPGHYYAMIVDAATFATIEMDLRAAPPAVRLQTLGPVATLT